LFPCVKPFQFCDVSAFKSEGVGSRSLGEAYVVLIDQSTSMWKVPIRQGFRSLLSQRILWYSVMNILHIRQLSAGPIVGGVVEGAVGLVFCLVTWFLMRRRWNDFHMTYPVSFMVSHLRVWSAKDTLYNSWVRNRLPTKRAVGREDMRTPKSCPPRRLSRNYTGVIEFQN
jgi:hypothetical protein